METTLENKKDYKKPFDEAEIKFPIYGVTKEQLGKDNLNALLSGRKTDAVIVKVKNKEGDVVEKVARISLKKREEGYEYAQPWLDYKNDKDLVIPETISGVKLSEEEKNNLTSGKVVFIKGLADEKNGRTYDSWVIVDKSLNKLAFISEKRLKAPEEIKGTKLTDAQREKWRNGETIFLKDMKKGDTDQKMARYITNNPITGNVTWTIPKGEKNNVELKKEETTVHDNKQEVSKGAEKTKEAPKMDVKATAAKIITETETENEAPKVIRKNGKKTDLDGDENTQKKSSKKTSMKL